MKILIIQTAFIGDVILATPLVEKLHAFFPDSKIDFLVRKGNESLLRNNPKINQVLVFNKKENKLRNLFKLAQNVRHQSYDWVINVHRYWSSGLIAGFSRAKRISGFDKNPLSFLYTHKTRHLIDKKSTLHEIERNLKLIEEFTDDKIIRPALYPGKEDFMKIKPDAEYICIAPSSVWYTKQFPAENWIKLIQNLNEKYVIYLLGSSNDLDLCTKIKEKSGSKKITIVAGELSFLESAALMKNARMNFVNDSAPAHLASSVNAPVTEVYCSTVPAFGFGPLSDISYVAETEEKLTCRPCGLHGKRKCPEKHFKCSNIDTKAMISKAGIII